jgi:hypothetical protein
LKKITLNAKSDGEDIRRYKHIVRTVAANPALRDDLAVHCAQYRQILEEEFGFLWKDGAEEVEAVAKDKMTNREILSRLLRRMISKTLIGACHGPLDRVCTGFPDHDRSRAKEIMNLMIRIGIIRAKKQEGSDVRVSIEPNFLGQCENFVQGQPFGQKAVDFWAQQDAAIESVK